MGYYNNGIVSNPYLQGHTHIQSPYGYQPPIQQTRPYNYNPSHRWGDPMMG
jgi:hypothetical protein